MVDVDKLIAQARAEREAEKKVHTADVTLGGARVTLGFTMVDPEEWDDLTSASPMRSGVEGDALLGYNPKKLASLYPRVILSGEELSAEKWAEVYSVLGSVWRNKVETVIWGINVHAQLQELKALGKGRSGKVSPSPEN